MKGKDLWNLRAVYIVWENFDHHTVIKWTRNELINFHHGFFLRKVRIYINQPVAYNNTVTCTWHIYHGALTRITLLSSFVFFIIIRKPFYYLQYYNTLLITTWCYAGLETSHNSICPSPCISWRWTHRVGGSQVLSKKAPMLSHVNRCRIQRHQYGDMF